MSNRPQPTVSLRCRDPGQEGNGRRVGDPEILTSGDAARQLNTTDDTIRSWIESGMLNGWWVQRGSRRRYFVPATALTNAPRPRRGPRRRDRSIAEEEISHVDATQLTAIRSELAELRELIVSGDAAAARAQIDQLRALVQNLQTAGLRMKDAMDHMHAAQKAQATATEHMMAAAQEQGEALAAFMLPSYPPDAAL
jgi:hypothetical protein